MIEREFRVLKALEGTGFPAPRALALCEDESVDRHRLLSDGALSTAASSGFRRCPNSTAGRTRADLRRDERRHSRKLHAIDVAAAGLSRLRQARQPFRPPAAALERPVSGERNRQNRRHGSADRLARERRARRRRPGRAGAWRLAHRQHDLRLLRPASLAVLDWELSTLGHPFADLAYQCMHWRLPHAASFTAWPVSTAGAGPPDRGRLVAAYCRRSGLEAIPRLGLPASPSACSATRRSRQACSSARSTATPPIPRAAGSWRSGGADGAFRSRGHRGRRLNGPLAFRAAPRPPAGLRNRRIDVFRHLDHVEAVLVAGNQRSPVPAPCGT